MIPASRHLHHPSIHPIGRALRPATRTLLLLCLFATILPAQDELKPVADATSSLESILGEDTDSKVEKVRLLSDAERKVNVSVTFSGFSDQPYLIKGAILNRSKKVLQGIKPVEVPLPTRGDNVDLSFTFRPDGSYRTAYIKSHYLQITISPAEKEDDLLSELDKLLDDSNAFSFDGTSYLYELRKDWRVGGNKSMVIKVTLTPLGQAKTIKP